MNNVAHISRERNRRFALGGIAVALTLVTGVVYGRWTQRWGPPADLHAAATRLEALPRVIGEWRALEDRPMADEVVRMLECAGYVHRAYVHQSTGREVYVVLVVGPPGPMAVHTPEICYSSRAYEIAESREKQLFNPAGGESHSLWATTFKSRNAGAEQMRVYYGWSAGDRWMASASPRFEFGGNALLYKIQVAGLIGPSQGNELSDPCRSFIDALLQDFWQSSSGGQARKH